MQVVRRSDTVLAPHPPPQGPSSHFRGVSLLRRTGRWHAQINFDGRQVHLGFFPVEQEAAAAYDRAAIIKWGAATSAAAGGPELLQPPQLNLGIHSYADELNFLGKLTPTWLISALGEERHRRDIMAALAHGFSPSGAPLAPKPAPILVTKPKREVMIAKTPHPLPSSIPREAPCTPPIGRQKRRKLAVPMHGPCM